MSVVYESQCHATCDNCGKIDMTSTMRLMDFKKKLRKANTERKARILAEEKLKKDGAFYVTNMRIEEITVE